MSQRRLSTGKIVTFLLTGFAVGGLALMLAKDFATGLADKTAGAQACTPASGVFKSYAAASGNAKVPEHPITTIDGAERPLSAWRGRPVVLNFWATWCAPCVKEMPALDRLHNILKADGIAVLAVSEDREGLPVAKKFHDVNKLRDLAVMADPKGALLRGFNGQGLPTTILIDKRGREVGRVTGAAEWDAPETVGFLKDCLGKGK